MAYLAAMTIMFLHPLDLQIYMVQHLHYHKRGGCVAMTAEAMFSGERGDCKDFATFAAEALQYIPGVADVKIAVYQPGRGDWHAVALYRYHGETYVISNGVIFLASDYLRNVPDMAIVIYPPASVDFCGVEMIRELQFIGGMR